MEETNVSRIGGIDVSHYQPNIVWEQVRAQGKKFAFLKSSEGTGIDPTYRLHYEGAKKAGFVPGAYHFFHPLRDPISQANTMLHATDGVAVGDLPHVCDIEWTDGLKVLGDKAAGKVLTFLDCIERHTGITPIIYTAPGFFLGEAHPERFARYPLWVADYSKNPPRLPAPWKQAAFHQYTQNEPVAGVGKIDSDWFLGDMNALLAMTKKA